MAGAAQQPNQSDNSMAVVWGIAALFAAGGVIWTVFKKQLVTFYFKLKLFEISIISLFTNKLDDVRATILASDPSSFTLQDVMHVGEAVGNYLRIPFVLIILVLAVVVYLGNSTRIFKRTYNMRDLAQLEKANWPQITPVINLDLIGTDIDKGPWAMALTPMQFCKRYNLIEERRRQPQEGMSRKERAQIEAILKRGAANKLFVVQLGPIWPGINKLPPHVKALFAAFAARINNDSQGAANLFAAMNVSSATKLNFSSADALCKKHESTKLVQAIVQSHAYLLTVMAEMLAAARSDGVQASADFLWLKPYDRRLWYMLNTVGRQTPFVEVAGPFAHWVAEKEMGKKLIVPFVEEATNALEVALKDIIYKPDEAEEDSPK
jgi:intracellular multiplication protein IcmP